MSIFDIVGPLCTFLERSLIKVTSFPFKFVGSSIFLGGGGLLTFEGGTRGVVQKRESSDFRSLKVGNSDIMFSALDEICILDHLYG